MKMSGYASVALVCLLVCFKSAYGGSSNSSSFFSLSDNPEITCSGYANCLNDTCNFNSTLKGNETHGYFAGTDMFLRCGGISLDVHPPPSKDKMPVGSYSLFCYNYTNSNNTVFDASQVVITKANNSDMGATTATLTNTNGVNYTVSLNETSDVVTIVVLPSSGCMAYVPPPPPTEAPTTTTSAPTSTSTGQPSSSSTSSSNTTTSDQTTTTTAAAGNGTVTPTAAPPNTITTAGGPTTTPSSGIKVEPTILLAFVAIGLFFLQV